mgnify:CR=1 FL=1
MTSSALLVLGSRRVWGCVGLLGVVVAVSVLLADPGWGVVGSSRDYYALLGVDREATEPVIKRAYRKLTAKWHPDRHNTEADKKRAQKKFIEITNGVDTPHTLVVACTVLVGCGCVLACWHVGVHARDCGASQDPILVWECFVEKLVAADMHVVC